MCKEVLKENQGTMKVHVLAMSILSTSVHLYPCTHTFHRTASFALFSITQKPRLWIALSLLLMLHVLIYAGCSSSSHRWLNLHYSIQMQGSSKLGCCSCSIPAGIGILKHCYWSSCWPGKPVEQQWQQQQLFFWYGIHLTADGCSLTS